MFEWLCESKTLEDLGAIIEHYDVKSAVDVLTIIHVRSLGQLIEIVYFFRILR
jgi:hypothetical protein